MYLYVYIYTSILLVFFVVVVVATNFFRNSTAHDVEHKN